MNPKITPQDVTEFTAPYTGRELIELLIPYASSRRFPQRIRIQLQEKGEPQCYLLTEGIVTLHRNADGLAIVTLKAPATIGFSNLDAYLVTTQPCHIAVIPRIQAYEIFKKEDSWALLAKHITTMSAKLYTYSKQLSAPTAYELIRHQLGELEKEPPTLRADITAERYIRDKTHLSRSGVMKILSDLKAGGYIEIHEGRLEKINHLPSKY